MRGIAMPADDQPNLFDPAPGAPRAGSPARASLPLPEGFKYQDDLITQDEERDLVRHIEPLPLKEFEFHSYTGKRRVISFGWRYDFNEHELQRVDDIPPFLLPLRDRCA